MTNREDRTAQAIVKAIDLDQLSYAQALDLSHALDKAIEAMAYYLGGGDPTDLVGALLIKTRCELAEKFKANERNGEAQ